ncbi:MAG: acetate/propionate family kinase [Planctomycetes bacterium]|nr:acetate/propionate family kinase [Planctomycetota bacterium]MCH9727441.1 acetate/propionate family kinase [Planctomycetota bacterium]MCH9775946.1 acetate/propionate family kinase [Planctomycetota bacterium]MCH9791063.1 acetate/propionate family kinase [Planctomycetota bacterium]
MKVLVANLGSTSFKYRLFDMPAEVQLARGGIDRIGEAQSHCFVEIGEHREENTENVPDHAAAVNLCLSQLTNSEWGCLSSADEVAGIGFKAVFAGNLSGIRLVDEELLTKMEALADIAPAHNPPYARAMRQLRQAFPEIPLVAALETAFHETIPAENRTYAIPFEWQEEYEVKRWGFHGASHRYIGTRMAELTGRDDLRVISCHLGGSSSLCAMQGGVSKANSLGMSPQTGLPHNNRVGDFDPFALPVLIKATGKSLAELLEDLSSKGGLLGMSGLSGDCRDLEEAAANGHERAEMALSVFHSAIRHYLGAYLTVLGGADAIVFTGGIGENSVSLREKVCSNLEWAGIRLDAERNKVASNEAQIQADDSQVQIWVVPTNEEIVVGRQTVEVIEGRS